MKVVMFWSYKGGSGRTVAAANAAAALAKLGKKVAIVDLDFEGPGLHHVFGVESMPQYRSGNGIQHYLRSDIELDQLESEVMIDLFSGPLRHLQGEIPEGAKLLYVLASHKIAQVNAAQNPHIVVRLRKLLQFLDDHHHVDYVLLDAAAGVRDAYGLAADVSDDILMFFRWSVQHVEGTLHMIRYTGMLKDYGQRYVPVRLVASAVPSASDLDALPDPNLRQALIRSKSDAHERIEMMLDRYQITPSKVFHEIPELLEMKWKEGVAVFGQEVSPYQQLVEKLLQAYTA